MFKLSRVALVHFKNLLWNCHWRTFVGIFIFSSSQKTVAFNCYRIPYLSFCVSGAKMLFDSNTGSQIFVSLKVWSNRCFPRWRRRCRRPSRRCRHCQHCWCCLSWLQLSSSSLWLLLLLLLLLLPSTSLLSLLSKLCLETFSPSPLSFYCLFRTGWFWGRWNLFRIFYVLDRLLNELKGNRKRHLT